LSVVAELLATTTFEQTTAAAATSARMEELARSSAAIADSVVRVARYSCAIFWLRFFSSPSASSSLRAESRNPSRC